MMLIKVDYPSTRRGARHHRPHERASPPVAQQVLTHCRLRGCSGRRQVFVHHALAEYVVRLVYATRTPAEHGLTDVALLAVVRGAPRASLGIVAAARAPALVRGP